MQWQAERYNYQTIEFARNSWPQTYYYYLYHSSKAYSLIEESEMPPSAGGWHPDVLGTLQAQGPRLEHRDPTVDPRPATRGAGGVGYYRNEQQRWYYDYAYTLMTQQGADGKFSSAAGTWGYSDCASQAYAILVLQRSVGGACLDSDEDGICDDVDNCPAVANENQADGDNDGVGDDCDECPGYDDHADADNDGVADGCDVCAGHDDNADADGDGVADGCDNCPDDANQGQEDADADGYGDVCDQCPATPEGNDPDLDRPGCPNNRPPVAVCADADVDAPADSCSAGASIEGGSSDPDGDPLQITQDPAGPYAVGSTGVTLNVSDGQFEDSCTATVAVNDVTSPGLLCSNPDTAECTGPAGTAVNLPAADASDACGIASLTNNAQAVYGLGDTGVTWTAADVNSNSSICDVTVTVADTMAPALVCADDVTVDADAECIGHASPTATATDICDAVPVVSRDPAATEWVLGTTTVSHTVTDASGNSSSCESLVTVEDNTPPAVSCNVPAEDLNFSGSELPISFPPATGSDNCSVDVTVEFANCTKDKDGSLTGCEVSADGATITILELGKGKTAHWTATATDRSGNSTTVDCYAGRGACNQGVGNGPEDCDPGNSNQGEPENSNDEEGGNPGDPGSKGGKKK